MDTAHCTKTVPGLSTAKGVHQFLDHCMDWPSHHAIITHKKNG